MFRTKTWAAGVALTAGLALALAGCSGDDGGDDTDTGTDTGTDAGTDDGGDSGELISVGFVAVGPEGGWRAANEKNIQDTFTEEAGFDLSYAPATNLDQASQIAAFTSFVDEGVDVILLSATEAPAGRTR